MINQSMMEGSGVTNYDTDKPSYAYSRETTEFDEALISRGIVTATQALMAKGASLSEAQRLLEGARPATTDTVPKEEKDDDDDDDESFLDDDEFMRQYREQRIEQLKEVAAKGGFGDVFFIDRTEWTVHVNDASEKAWVVICLTSSNGDRTGCLERCIKQFAREQPHVKCVLIPSHQAIENWPDTNLPTLFLYRHRKMQKQLVKLPVDLSFDELSDLLMPILEA